MTRLETPPSHPPPSTRWWMMLKDFWVNKWKSRLFLYRGGDFTNLWTTAKAHKPEMAAGPAGADNQEQNQSRWQQPVPYVCPNNRSLRSSAPIDRSTAGRSVLWLKEQSGQATLHWVLGLFLVIGGVIDPFLLWLLKQRRAIFCCKTKVWTTGNGNWVCPLQVLIACYTCRRLTVLCCWCCCCWLGCYKRRCSTLDK